MLQQVSLRSYLLPLHMLAALLHTVATSAVYLVLALPAALGRCFAARNCEAAVLANCVFYEGIVTHIRRQPVHNSFRYPVRVAVIDLDNPPDWWESCTPEHLTADQARSTAGTTGPVKLLTNPTAANYSQNPISVYYCCDHANRLEKCIAEVTNTPWAARVSFLFAPGQQSVPKALHVSPFMDMRNTWHLKAPLPDSHLYLSVSASHPGLGSYFDAVLTGHVSEVPALRNEHAGWRILFKYGFQPQRIACLIYWQALKLLWKGAPFFSPPDNSYKEHVAQHATNEADSRGCRFAWEGAKDFPWNVQQ